MIKNARLLWISSSYSPCCTEHNIPKDACATAESGRALRSRNKVDDQGDELAENQIDHGHAHARGYGTRHGRQLQHILLRSAVLEDALVRISRSTWLSRME